MEIMLLFRGKYTKYEGGNQIWMLERLIREQLTKKTTNCITQLFQGRFIAILSVKPGNNYMGEDLISISPQIIISYPLTPEITTGNLAELHD